MTAYSWPERGTTSLLGTSQDRIDGLPKCTGAAKYAYDVAPPRMLIARALGCPHAHCKVKKIDVSAARKVPGVARAEGTATKARGKGKGSAQPAKIVPASTMKYASDLKHGEEVSSNGTHNGLGDGEVPTSRPAQLPRKKRNRRLTRSQKSEIRIEKPDMICRILTSDF